MPVPKRLIEYFYPGCQSLGISPFDGTIAFYDRVNHLCPEGATILDYGAGDGHSISNTSGWRKSQLLIANARRRVGADADAGVLSNKFIQESHQLEASNHWRLPIADDSIDLVVCDWVVEHLPDPLSAFSDIHRVLKPGGWFCARTGNIRHYSYGVANLVKNTALERRLLGFAQGDRHTWPKRYRANTPSRLRRSIAYAGFRECTIVAWEPEPAYGMRSLPLFLFGVLWQRMAEAGMLPKATLLVFARKALGPE